MGLNVVLTNCNYQQFLFELLSYQGSVWFDWQDISIDQSGRPDIIMAEDQSTPM